MALSSTPNSFSLLQRLRGAGWHGIAGAVLAVLVVFGLIGLFYNTAGILALPQSGLKAFEIIWVSFTACVLVILLAMAVAALLEATGNWLAPTPRSEQWLREQLLHHRVSVVAGARAAEQGKVSEPAGKAASSGSSAA